MFSKSPPSHQNPREVSLRERGREGELEEGRKGGGGARRDEGRTNSDLELTLEKEEAGNP